MNLYLENLLPRIKQYSKDLDHLEIFIDLPWITIDENQKKYKYIFKRNGELLMSSDGQVKIGYWEYLSAAKSLLINRIDDKILLNQYFVDGAVMVLKLDGPNENFILANEQIIPDFNVSIYLKNLYYKKNNIGTITLNNKHLLEISNYSNGFFNNSVLINGESVADGTLEQLNTGKKYEIIDSRINRVLIDKTYKSDKGDLVIEYESYMGRYVTGDLVKMNGNAAPDGKYELGFLRHIYVKNGKLVTKKLYNLT